MMIKFTRLAPDDGLPEADCVVIEFACGHYFVNGYVRTNTGGFFAAFCPQPYERSSDAIKAASSWASQYRLSEVLTRGCELS